MPGTDVNLTTWHDMLSETSSSHVPMVQIQEVSSTLRHKSEKRMNTPHAVTDAHSFLLLPITIVS